MTDQRQPLNIEQQADLIRCLIRRATMRDGRVARETIMTLSADDVADLRHIEARLRRMAPYEGRIRSIVTGGRR